MEILASMLSDSEGLLFLFMLAVIIGLPIVIWLFIRRNLGTKNK